MRILAACIGGWGHAEPLLAIADEARRRGHDVVFAAQSAIAPRLRDLGYVVHEVGPDTVGPERRPLRPVDREHERFVVREHFAGSMARVRLAPLQEVAVAVGAELVLCDEMDVAAMLVAELLALPRVTVSVLAAGLLAAPAVLDASMLRLRAELALPRVPTAQALDGDGVIVPAPPSFRDPAAHLAADALHVRPPIIDALRPGEGGVRRVVYITLGTIFNVESGDLFARLVDAARRLVDDPGIDVVVSVGPSIDPHELGPMPERVTIAAFVDHVQLLPRCIAVVCHGGSGTVIAALALGIPLVLLPMGADQPDNGDRCEQLGVGVVLDVMSCTADDVVAAVRRVTADPAFAESAVRVAQECAALPPATVVVDRLEALVRGRPGTSTRSSSCW